ncbi:MAG: 5-formyltetrahydrofolate cyclo-ligase [Puniceicoccales bacterium]|jgi:5-formyltetrahydrofolate cyclo-ligase|nr:5-formyltetrahydrofolate cyclo-ligase [Puniceicoccales bacterium]
MPEEPHSPKKPDPHPGRRAVRQSVRCLRREFVEKTSPGALLRCSQALLDRLREFGPWRKARTPCAYVAMPGEAPTEAILADCFLRGIPVAVPLVTGATLELRFVEKHEELQAGAFGILEPRAATPPCPPESVDCILLPGLAFDPRGNRLGHGMGYYDRLLQHVPAGVPRIGVAFEWQIFPAIPALPHDIPATHIATPERLFECARG